MARPPGARRGWLQRGLGLLGLAGLGGLAAPRPLPAATGLVAGPPDDDAGVRPGRPMRWPRDQGAHLGTQTEWWYLTGALALSPGPASLNPPHWGFQITFFRSRHAAADRPDAAPNPSPLVPRQLLFAHVALTELARPGVPARHRHDQRITRWDGRRAEGPAYARQDGLAVRLGSWQLERGPDGRYRARVDSRDAGFALDLQLQPTQPLLLQGEAGYSRKGPGPGEASHYLSHPQLQVLGRLGRDGRADAQAVQGRAWLDQEWSNTLLSPQAQGWDWVGFNLDDGSALTAFQIRPRHGLAGPDSPATPPAPALWAGGSWRAPGQAQARAWAPADLRWEPLRLWTSPLTGARYPVAWRLHTPAGVFEVHALLDAQELDSRASTGAIYWEGLSELRDAAGRRLGLGYLEMTGYAAAMRL